MEDESKGEDGGRNGEEGGKEESRHTKRDYELFPCTHTHKLKEKRKREKGS